MSYNGTIPSSLNSTAFNYFLGSYGGTSRFFHGQLDESRLWSTNLSETEIRTWMTRKLNENHPQLNNLVAYYRFDDNTGTTLLDLTENKNGTLTNMDGSTDWVYSGAAIGDTSVYKYGSTSAATYLQLGAIDAAVDYLSAGGQGIHLYSYYGLPENTSTPSFVTSLDSSFVFGVFATPSSSDFYPARIYTSTSYSDNDTLRLLKKDFNFPNTFNLIDTVSLSKTADIVGAPAQTSGEFILAQIPPPMSGTYVIDKNGTGDFLSFSEAAENMRARGVDGHITFQVKEGIYNEQVSFGDYFRTATVWFVYFEQHPSNTQQAEITYSSTHPDSNYTFQLNGIDNYNIDSLVISATGTQYGRAVSLIGNNEDVTFEFCTINAAIVNDDSPQLAAVFDSAGTGNNSTRVDFRDCNISGGSYGMYLGGNVSGSGAVGCDLRRNTITNFYASGIRAFYYSGLVVLDNKIYITSNDDFTSGIYLISMDAGDTRIRRNYISDSASTSGYTIGIRCSGVNGVSGTPTTIYTNEITLNAGVYSYCIWAGDDYVDIYNNSIRVGPNAADINTRLINVTFGTNISIYNNILYAEGNSRLIYAQDAPTNLLSDNNLFYIANGDTGVVSSINGVNSTSLSDHQTNQNSIPIEISQMV